MKPKWIAGSIPANAAAAPIPAPVTVPKLQHAWNQGMMLRPFARSDPAPDTFMATSAIPLAMPYKAKPAIVRTKLLATDDPMPIATSDTPHPAMKNRMVRRPPSQCTRWLEKMSPTIEPTETLSSRKPTSVIEMSR